MEDQGENSRWAAQSGKLRELLRHTTRQQRAAQAGTDRIQSEFRVLTVMHIRDLVSDSISLAIQRACGNSDQEAS